MNALFQIEKINKTKNENKNKSKQMNKTQKILILIQHSKSFNGTLNGFYKKNQRS